MKEQIQYFLISGLIFTSPAEEHTVIDSADVSEVQKRFMDIIKSFRTSNNHYQESFVKNSNNNLPYNSSVAIGEFGNNLILHFTSSYHENNSVMFIISIKDKTVRNFIDFNDAKEILDEDVYKAMKEELCYPKHLDRMYKNIPNVNDFVKNYYDILNQHKSQETVTGYQCFEIDLDDFNR